MHKLASSAADDAQTIRYRSRTIVLDSDREVTSLEMRDVKIQAWRRHKQRYCGKTINCEIPKYIVLF